MSKGESMEKGGDLQKEEVNLDENKRMINMAT
jgi:hypothetical protein